MTSRNKSRLAKKLQPKVQTESSSSELVRQVANLPDEKKLELYAILEMSRIGTAFSGPLPHPEDFKKYADILPNAADRIMAMAENEQKIRADGQAGMLANDRKRINGSIWLGTSLIVVAGLATWLGHALIALPLGLVGVFSSLIRLVRHWFDRQQSGN